METKCYHEIKSQEAAWEEAVRVTSQNKQRVRAFFEETKPDQVIFLGCTSPYYAGMAAAAQWKMESGIAAQAVQSSELVLYPSLYISRPTVNPVLIALSRSGKTTETTWAIEEFERHYPDHTILITCNPDSRMAEMAKIIIGLPKSNEETIPQTRSLSAMYLSSLLIEAYCSEWMGVIETLEQAPGKVEGIIRNSEAVITALFAGKSYKNIFVLGSGPLYGIALEIGLKCMEMSTCETFSYPFLESRHGPRALIDENSLVIGLYSRGGLNYEAEVMDELTQRHGATSLAVTPQAGWKTGAVSAEVSVDCDWADGLIGLAYLPVGQLAAYYNAMSRGMNPDTARRHTAYVEIARF